MTFFYLTFRIKALKDQVPWVEILAQWVVCIFYWSKQIFFIFIQNLQTAVVWVFMEIKSITEMTPNHRKNYGWKTVEFLTKMRSLVFYVPYARHHNLRFVYFLPTFWKSKTFFKEVFSENSAFMCGLHSRACYDGSGMVKLIINYENMSFLPQGTWPLAINNKR